MKKKLKLYLDTSVISHLDAKDTPEKMADTLALWEEIKAGKYEIVISDVTTREIDQCNVEKLARLEHFMSQISFESIVTTPQMEEIAQKFIDLSILTKKSFDDCLHIAAAIVGEADVIVSWNFKHIVNHKTIQGAKAITALEGFREILIYSPSVIIGG